MIGEALRYAGRAVGRTVDAGEQWLFDGKKATYGLAAMRILIGVAILGSLVANLGYRHYVWGPGARWLTPWLATDEYGFPFTAAFAQTDGTTVFTLKYLLLAALAVAFTLGWRTRIVTPLLMIGMASLIRLNPLGDDAGDNIVRIMLLFLCFADTARRWSLDARRRDRPGYRPLLQTPPWLGVLFHNVALIAVAAQVFVIYMTSGLSKVQGSMWQEGVGLYYPLRIGQYAPWPGLNELVYTNGFFVTVASYVTVFVQVLFPLLLLRRGTRVLALLAVFAMHFGIAVTMALPWFSLAMVAADMVFIRDDTYRALFGWVTRSRRRPPPRAPDEAAAQAAEPEPDGPGPEPDGTEAEPEPDGTEAEDPVGARPTQR